MSLIEDLYPFPSCTQDRVAALVAAGVDAVILDSSQVQGNGVIIENLAEEACFIPGC